MYQPLVPCPACDRHVRATESACPFCSSALPADIAAKIVPGATQRMSRAAAFVFTASLAVTACGSNVGGGSGGSGAGANSSGRASSGSRGRRRRDFTMPAL